MSLAGQMNPPGRQREKLPQKAAGFVTEPALIASRGNHMSPNFHYTGRGKSAASIGFGIQESGVGIRGCACGFSLNPESWM